ncbi:Protein NRT1/ PTR FAMILY 8.3 [Zea mays]|uniref:Protein NRT1/ PTR FAMILY 8.3 n=1 Tax=Zea mays TaxID=4577 RepID=A0A1D6JVE4_MAIZE|nr:Protein NRT1/ PTR FAMILY 8.3 [Zea mays]
MGHNKGFFLTKPEIRPQGGSKPGPEGTEVCERLAYYGISKSLVTYLSTRLHEGNVSAARNFTTWQGTCYLTPLIGATLADSYWGKYRTIAVFSTIYFLVRHECAFTSRYL